MTAAVILAAGSGRRMGGPKALVSFRGQTLLQRTVRVALEAGCEPVIAVVGNWDPGALCPRVHVVHNPEAAEGMASSIRSGIAAVPTATTAALILAVDQPAVDAALLRNLLALAATHPDRPAACAYAGTIGIPAVLPWRLFPELQALHGDRGAKALLLREGAATLRFDAGAVDLDRPEDLDRFGR